MLKHFSIYFINKCRHDLTLFISQSQEFFRNQSNFLSKSVFKNLLNFKLKSERGLFV